MPKRSGTHAVVYYSRDGHTARLARQLADKLDAEIFEIETGRYRSKLLGYVRAGFDSLTGRLPKIMPIPNLKTYASVSLGAPVWTSYPATPMRSFLAQQPNLPPVVGIFATCGGHSPPDKAFSMARALFGQPFIATLCIPSLSDEKLTRVHIAAYCNAIATASGMLETA